MKENQKFLASINFIDGQFRALLESNSSPEQFDNLYTQLFKMFQSLSNSEMDIDMEILEKGINLQNSIYEKISPKFKEYLERLDTSSDYDYLHL